MVTTISKRDWEEFRAVGRIPSSVREFVLQSWKRSADHGVNGQQSAPKLNEYELFLRRKEARRLRLSAQVAFQKAGYLLNNTGTMLLLCNNNGDVLDVSGDATTQARGQENNLHIGGNWNEASIGTNAIGTAIHLGRPIQVSSVEHYCEEIHRWNCAATPVMDPVNGKLLGVIDISWPNNSEHPNAWALSTALASQIEADLGRYYAFEREKLAGQLYLRRSAIGSDPVLIMDRSGRDVFSSDNFQRLCDNRDALNSLRERIPDLMEERPQDIVEELSGLLPEANLEVISEGDNAIGVMLSLRRNRLVSRNSGADLDKIGRIGPVTFALCNQAHRLATANISVLIEGETGTGKTFLAQAIHRAGGSSGSNFEMLDCSTLTEQELREDITRQTRRVSMLEQIAEKNSTLCLERLTAMTLPAQKLLLCLLDQLSSRTGNAIRLLSLSSTSLYELTQQGTFRSDLYYRLAGARLLITPLRQRRQEIVSSLNMVAEHHAQNRARRKLRFTSGALNLMEAYHWPGNLLEMSNLIAMLDALSPSGLIDQKSLPEEFWRPVEISRDHTLRGSEKSEILETLERTDGNLTETARLLGIARSTLYLKLDSYGIARPLKKRL